MATPAILKTVQGYVKKTFKRPLEWAPPCLTFLITVLFVCQPSDARSSAARAEGVRCYIVSGWQDEKREAGYMAVFEDHWKSTRLGITRFGDLSCTRFKNWKSLMNYHSKRGPVTRLLIIQASHGSPGGGAYVDRLRKDQNEVKGSEIFENLRTLSESSKVTLIGESCYAGDLILKKLYFDRRNPSHPSVDNLCMISKSPFGVETYAEGYPDLFRKTDFHTQSSALRFFHQTRASMISASPWSALIDAEEIIRDEYAKDKRGNSFEFEKLDFYATGYDRKDPPECNHLRINLYELVARRLEKELSATERHPGAPVKPLYPLDFDFSEFEAQLEAAAPGGCPWASRVEPLLKSLRNDEKIQFRDLARLLPIVGEMSDAGYVYDAYFGKVSRDSLNDPDLEWSQLDRRRFEACRNF